MSYPTNKLHDSDVQKWIKDLFQDEEINIPELGGNDECMKLISDIMFLNQEAEKDAKGIIETELNCADYYERKNVELYNSFSQEISVENLSPDVIENVNKIAFVAAQMKLKEPTITNFLLGSCALENQKAHCVEQEIINVYRLSNISKKITDIMQKNAVLERNIESLEKIVSKQQAVKSGISERCKFLQIKGDEYKKRIRTIEKQLKKSGWNTSLSHSELVKRFEALQCLEHKVNNLASKLDSYQNLPPNEMLTKFKIEESQAELLHLQKEFDNLLKVLC